MLLGDLVTFNARHLSIAFIAVLGVGAFTVYRLGSTIGDQVVAESVPAQVQPLMSPATPPTPQKSNAGSIANLVGPLEERLKKQPDDVSSWILLGKSYDYLGQSERAQAAFSKAKELGSSDPAVGAALASAPIPGKAKPLDARQMLQIGRQLDQSASPDAQPRQAQPLQVQTKKRQAPTGDVAITGRITIADELLGRIKPSHRLFIFAKTPDGQGMPLAVTQVRADQLPFDYRLDNTMTMVAGQSLVSAQGVQVIARVSTSGDVTRRAGDLMATSEAIVLSDNNTVDLEINQIVQE